MLRCFCNACDQYIRTCSSCCARLPWDKWKSNEFTLKSLWNPYPVTYEKWYRRRWGPILYQIGSPLVCVCRTLCPPHNVTIRISLTCVWLEAFDNQVSATKSVRTRRGTSSSLEITLDLTMSNREAMQYYLPCLHETIKNCSINDTYLRKKPYAC